MKDAKARNFKEMIGYSPCGVPKKFIGRDLKVTTKNGLVFCLKSTNKKNEWIVGHKGKRKLGFSKARVMHLKIGDSLAFAPCDGDDIGYFCSYDFVAKIELL